MDFELICKIKEKNPKRAVIVRDGNKVSLGWKEAEEFAAAKKCTIGVIRSLDGDRIPWVVRHNLREVESFFEKQGKKYVVVDGSGITIPKFNESRKTKAKSKKVNDMSKRTIFDSWNGFGGFKKANPVNTDVSTKNAEGKAKEVEARRGMVDTSIHPNGVRYGDAYRYRRKRKK